MTRATLLAIVFAAGLIASAALQLAGQHDAAFLAFGVVWGVAMVAVVWLALIAPTDPARMPSRRLPAVPPPSQPDPQTRDLERVLTRRLGYRGHPEELAAALAPLVARVGSARRRSLPSGLVRFCDRPQRLPAPGTLRIWLDALQEASDDR